MKSRKPPNRRSASAPSSRCGRLACAIRVLVEILPADEVHLDAESSPLVAFPDRIQRSRMCRRQRYGTTHLFVGVELGRSGPRVRRERDKTLTTVSQQQLRSRSACALRGVEKLHVAGVEISRHDWLKHDRSEYRPRDLDRSEDARHVERGVARALGAQAAERPQTRQAGFFGLLGERRRSKRAGAGGDANRPSRCRPGEQRRSAVSRGLRIRNAYQRVR